MIKVGLIGAGGMGNVHTMKYRQMPNVDLRFFDRSTEHAAAFAAKHGVQSVGDVSELIDWADVVDVCLPTDMHLETAEVLLRAGKGVLMEKPMAFDLDQCRHLIRLQDSTGGWVMPLHVVRFFPEFKKAAQVISEGSLGRIATLRTRRGGLFPKGSDGWFRDFRRSGGVLLDLCMHDFDWMRWVNGEVRRVLSRSLAFTREGDLPGDYALTILEFENGAIGHVEGTWLDPGGFRTTIEVCGDKGQLEHDSRLTKSLVTNSTTGSASESPVSGGDDPYFVQLSSALAAWEARETPPVTSRDGFAAVAISRAAMASAASGDWVSVESL